MDSKLRDFTIKKTNPYEFNNNMKAINEIIERMVPRSKWTESLKNHLNGVGCEISDILYPPIEDLECQYESKNSRNNDL